MAGQEAFVSLWWLSFVDPSRPAADRFLGVAIVAGGDIVEAVKAAHALGCNPGGDVAGYMVPYWAERAIGTWTRRLLTREEATSLARDLKAIGPS